MRIAGHGYERRELHSELGVGQCVDVGGDIAGSLRIPGRIELEEEVGVEPRNPVGHEIEIGLTAGH